MRKKDLNQRRFEYSRVDQTVKRPVEVGVMIDIIPRLLRHILAVCQIDRAKNYSRNRQHGKEQDLPPRVQKDRGKQDGRYSPRSTYRYIIRIITPADQIIQGGSNHPAKVQPQLATRTEP